MFIGQIESLELFDKGEVNDRIKKYESSKLNQQV